MASIPQLVKISDDKFMVLWQEYVGASNNSFNGKDKNGILKYVYIDGEGNILGSVQTVKYFMQSMVQPIVQKNKVTWYTNENNKRTFYSIPIT